jgi:acyl-coenzyme A thioesterase PaaI-like protein
MPFHEILRNVNGVLHGGGATLLVEQAARQVAAAVGGGSEAVVDGIEVHFLAPGLTGPFLASVEPLAGGSSIVAGVEATDLGRGGRPIALGLVSFRPGA